MNNMIDKIDKVISLLLGVVFINLFVNSLHSEAQFSVLWQRIYDSALLIIAILNLSQVKK